MRGTAGEPGLIPLAVREVFEMIEKCEDREFLLRVSYMEVRPPWFEAVGLGQTSLRRTPWNSLP